MSQVTKVFFFATKLNNSMHFFNILVAYPLENTEGKIKYKYSNI